MWSRSGVDFDDLEFGFKEEDKPFEKVRSIPLPYFPTPLTW
jgi:hypothetical protein